MMLLKALLCTLVVSSNAARDGKRRNKLRGVKPDQESKMQRELHRYLQRASPKSRGGGALDVLAADFPARAFRKGGMGMGSASGGSGTTRTVYVELHIPCVVCISVYFHSVLTFPIGRLAEFFHFPYNEAVPVSPSSTDLKAEGTVYIFDGSVAEIMNVTEVPGTGIAGVCTKIQEVQYVGSQITLLGGGYCHFTYTLSMGITGTIDSFSAEGEVFDDLISSLSITGGTGSFALARGDLVIQPGYLDNATGIDFFTDAHLYFVNGTIFY